LHVLDYRLWVREAQAAMPPLATPPLPSRGQAHHQIHPFPNPKKSRRGNFKKYAKGVSGGAQRALVAR